MNYSFLKFITPVLLIGFLLISCSSNDSQREFEREAFDFPDGFTQTNDRGDIINGNIDPDDWRIGPFFQGFVSVEKTAHPNPVLTNQQVRIELLIMSINAVHGLRVYVLHDFNFLKSIYPDQQNTLPPGLISINLNPLDIARFPENPRGLYRLIITDGTDNVITYGDVKIE